MFPIFFYARGQRKKRSLSDWKTGVKGKYRKERGDCFGDWEDYEIA